MSERSPLGDFSSPERTFSQVMMIDTTNKSAEKPLTGLQKLTMRLSSMRKRKSSVSFAKSPSSLNSGDNSAFETLGLMRLN